MGEVYLSQSPSNANRDIIIHHTTISNLIGGDLALLQGLIKAVLLQKRYTAILAELAENHTSGLLELEGNQKNGLVSH